jgi:hypothetical protein
MMNRFVLLVALFASTSAFAETKNFYDTRGNKIGSATTYDNVTVFYDVNGDRTGTAATSPSGVTTFRDKNGQIEAMTSGPLNLGNKR